MLGRRPHSDVLSYRFRRGNAGPCKEGENTVVSQSASDLLPFFALFMVITLANLVDRRREAAGFGVTFASHSYASTAVSYGIAAYFGLTIQDHILGVWPDQDLPRNSAIWAAGIWVPAIAALLFLLPVVRKNWRKLYQSTSAAASMQSQSAYP